MLAAGTLIDEKYEIDKSLGFGGFGSVYLAEHRLLDRKVAIKFLHPTLKLSPDALPRFEREAKALHALKHKNIVGFYGYGLGPDGAPYMVMEYLHGKSLSDLLAGEQALDPARVLKISRQIFEALACAHSHGVIHRDLKPSNIIVDDQDDVKIIDFGLAKLLPEGDATCQKLTETGFTLGSFQYAAPEQAFGANVDGRSDLYSAGCIIYHMLSGHPPFDADDPMNLMAQHISQAPPRLPRGEDQISGPLETFVLNCMAKSPDERYQSAQEALAELTLVNTGRVVAKRASDTSVKSKPKRRLVPIALSLASVAVLLIGGYAYKVYSDAVEKQHDQVMRDAEDIERYAAVNLGTVGIRPEVLAIEARENKLHAQNKWRRFLLAVMLCNMYTSMRDESPSRSIERDANQQKGAAYAVEAWNAIRNSNEKKYWDLAEVMEALFHALGDHQTARQIDDAMLASPFIEVVQSGRQFRCEELLKEGRRKEAHALAQKALDEGHNTVALGQYFVSVLER